MNTAQVGGIPTVAVDVPISACLIFVFLCLAVTHMTIFQINLRRKHKFVFSAMLFGLSIARITALTMRIVWATHTTNISVGMAATILTQAGVVVVFVANLFFTQRIVRAYHATVGWHKYSRLIFRFLVACVLACLIMVIICTVHMFYTLDATARAMDRKVQLTAGVFLAFLAFVPAPAVALAVLVPGSRPVEKFGAGRLRSKVRLLLFTSLLLTLGAGFRVGTNFAPRAANDPAWYHHRACYYVLNYGIEIIVSALYAAVRFDRRFHIPNGAKGPGDYAAGKAAGLQVDTEGERFGTDDDDSVEEHTATATPTEWDERFRQEQKLENGTADV
jgi:hypothetical protein